MLHWPGLHEGDDIYVLGSGATAGFVDPGFFDHKIVVAVNRAGERMGLYERPVMLYTHTHYHAEDAVPLAQQHDRHWFFAPQGEQGHAGQPAAEHRLPNIIYYPHQPTEYDFDVDRAWPPEGGLLVGSTSLHGAMDLACAMGAVNVILVGADCGTLDDATNQHGYQSGNLAVDDPYPWLRRWQAHLMEVKTKLEAEYGARIYSLLPFANGNMDGHVWRA